MCALFKSVSNISTRITRSNVKRDLYAPRTRTNISKDSFAVNGAHIWNNLDLKKQENQTLCVFKKAYMLNVLN